jgi:DNA/RNA-binding domain of Phe-tRNA-synthetase-like protein
MGASDIRLDEAWVESAVFALRPDYMALLVIADWLAGGASDAASDALLVEAERAALARLGGRPPEERPHVAEWRDAYRAFGAKPQRTRSSLEALLRRVPDGLPRINRLTDVYNAVSVLHEIPVGGEDLARYVGAPRLVRATGEEPFETAADGAAVVEHPEPGEVIWCDEAGVTCRRWNWRQCTRTQLTPATTSALFILDGLGAIGRDGLLAAGEDLAARLRTLDPGAVVVSRLITP